jgi:hypothetical protein
MATWLDKAELSIRFCILLETIRFKASEEGVTGMLAM